MHPASAVDLVCPSLAVHLGVSPVTCQTVGSSLVAAGTSAASGRGSNTQKLEDTPVVFPLSMESRNRPGPLLLAAPFAAFPSSAAVVPPSYACRFRPALLLYCGFPWLSLSPSLGGQCTLSNPPTKVPVASSHCVLDQSKEYRSFEQLSLVREPREKLAAGQVGERRLATPVG